MALEKISRQCLNMHNLSLFALERKLVFFISRTQWLIDRAFDLLVRWREFGVCLRVLFHRRGIVGVCPVAARGVVIRRGQGVRVHGDACFVAIFALKMNADFDAANGEVISVASTCTTMC